MTRERGRSTEPEYARCFGPCGQMKPKSGVGSDGRCLDCRVEPIRSYVPPLSNTKRRRAAGGPKWIGYLDDDDDD